MLFYPTILYSISILRCILLLHDMCYLMWIAWFAHVQCIPKRCTSFVGCCAFCGLVGVNFAHISRATELTLVQSFDLGFLILPITLPRFPRSKTYEYGHPNPLPTHHTTATKKRVPFLWDIIFITANGSLIYSSTKRTGYLRLRTQTRFIWEQQYWSPGVDRNRDSWLE